MRCGFISCIAPSFVDFFLLLLLLLLFIIIIVLLLHFYRCYCSDDMLIYPALSASMDSETHRLYGKGYYLSFDTISWMQKNYLAHKSDYQDWRFAPLDGSKNAPTDWRNLAPAWIASTPARRARPPEAQAPSTRMIGLPSRSG